MSAADIHSTIATLKTQVSQVMEMMTLLAVGNSEKLGETSQVAPFKKSVGSVICYKCGDVGHHKQVAEKGASAKWSSNHLN